MPLKALAFNCTLKPSPAPSSTDKLLQELLAALSAHEVTGDIIRAVDYNIKLGVSSDEGASDAWPELRRQIVDSNILIIGSPIWLGQPSSVAKRVLERMDAFLGEKDDKGRMPSYGKVGMAAVVGNEDGAHHAAAEVLQALLEVGCSDSPGEAMCSVNYIDLKKTPTRPFLFQAAAAG